MRTFGVIEGLSEIGLRLIVLADCMWRVGGRLWKRAFMETSAKRREASDCAQVLSRVKVENSGTKSASVVQYISR